MVTEANQQGILSFILESVGLKEWNVLLINLILSVIILVVGIFIARFISSFVKKSISKSGIDRKVQKSFLELLVTFIRWSIYILFINISLSQLRLPQFTNWITNVLVVFPALVGSLLILTIGFAIAIYLKSIIEESKIEGWNILSKTIFYFVFYSFILFAFKTLMVRQDSTLVNNLILYISIIVGIGITYLHVYKKKN